MKLIAVNALQLTAEMYLIIFLVNIIIYLLHELIIQYSISESNFIIRYVKKLSS